MRNSPLVLTWLAIGVVCLQNEARCDDAPVPLSGSVPAIRIISRPTTAGPTFPTV